MSLGGFKFNPKFNPLPRMLRLSKEFQKRFEVRRTPKPPEGLSAFNKHKTDWLNIANKPPDRIEAIKYKALLLNLNSNQFHELIKQF
tara:strand:+ start:319 stop:579 length:261 start_codon:yes stop_codon:yes gene_type:complete